MSKSTIERDYEILTEFLAFPLGSTREIFEKFDELPDADWRGSGAEQFLFVPGSRNNRVLLLAHADTVWDNTATPFPNIVYENGKIYSPMSGLGADDRAGCAILWLLKDFGHSLLITSGEERGRLGSKWLMEKNLDIAREINSNHQFAVQFDRRNEADYKCYNVGTSEFREYIESVLGYTEPDRRSFTDIIEICQEICGVNLSIGYYYEHTPQEYIMVDEWQNTLNLCRDWLSIETLPVFRR